MVGQATFRLETMCNFACTGATWVTSGVINPRHLVLYWILTGDLHLLFIGVTPTAAVALSQSIHKSIIPRDF